MFFKTGFFHPEIKEKKRRKSVSHNTSLICVEVTYEMNCSESSYLIEKEACFSFHKTNFEIVLKSFQLNSSL